MRECLKEDMESKFEKVREAVAQCANRTSAFRLMNVEQTKSQYGS